MTAYGSAVAGLQPRDRDHVSVLYRGDDERDALVQAIVGGAMVAGENCLFLHDRCEPARVHRLLAEAGSAPRVRDQLDLQPARPRYLSGGTLDPAGVVHGWKTHFDEMAARTGRRARGVAEMSWSLSGGVGADAVLAYERLLDRSIPNLNLSAYCFYDINRFGLQQLAGVLSTHGRLVVGGRLIANPAYPAVSGLEGNETTHLLSRLLIDAKDFATIEAALWSILPLVLGCDLVALRLGPGEGRWRGELDGAALDPTLLRAVDPEGRRGCLGPEPLLVDGFERFVVHRLPPVCGVRGTLAVGWRVEPPDVPGLLGRLAEATSALSAAVAIVRLRGERDAGVRDAEAAAATLTRWESAEELLASPTPAAGPRRVVVVDLGAGLPLRERVALVGSALDAPATIRAGLVVVVAEAEAVVADMLGALQARLPGTAIGIVEGPVGSTTAELQSSLQETVWLKVLAGDREGVLRAEDVGVWRLLAASGDRRRVHEFAERWLGPLLAYDNAKGASLVATVAAYLRHGLHLAEAAAAVGVHLNTFKYRLHRAEEIGNIDLRDPEVRLHLDLALRARQLLDVTAPG